MIPATLPSSSSTGVITSYSIHYTKLYEIFDGVAMNGAGVIHDVELALAGKTRNNFV